MFSHKWSTQEEFPFGHGNKSKRNLQSFHERRQKHMLTSGIRFLDFSFELVPLNAHKAKIGKHPIPLGRLLFP